MLKMIEKIDDKVEEWNIPNISMSTFVDLCDHYTRTFLVLSKYKDNTKVIIKLYNGSKLLLTFKLKKH